MASSSPRQRSAANPASPQETLALVPQTQAAYPHVPLRGSRQTVKRNYAEIDLSDLEGQCDEADEQSFMPSVGQKKRGRPAKRVSRKRPTYTRPAIAKTITFASQRGRFSSSKGAL
ncbi:hypothetical protein BT69DRAFT_301268 [Atractiella rhizophila]|nr:hypothetical protein BT69DRAFT_301268 [Atractiella rhizophila]